MTWVNIDGIHKVEIIKETGDSFNIHPLVLEDVMNVDQRPKIEDYEAIKTKLMELLFGERVILKDAVAIKEDALVCRVYIQGKELAEYFTEYQ